MENQEVKVMALDANKIETIEDVKLVLKALNIGIMEEYVDEHGLGHLVMDIQE